MTHTADVKTLYADGEHESERGPRSFELQKKLGPHGVTQFPRGVAAGRAKHPMGGTVVIVTCSMLACGCGANAGQTLDRLGQVARIGTSVALQLVLCEKAEKPYKLSSGNFTVPRGGCTPKQLDNGNIRLTLKGAGHFKQTRLALLNFEGDFSNTVSVEFQVCVDGGYVYLVPESDPRVGQPTLSKTSFFASALPGMVKQEIHDKFGETLRTPKTFIFSMNKCIISGYIPPGTTPTRCDGPDEQHPIEMGGDEVPKPQMPPGWTCPASALNVTARLASPTETATPDYRASSTLSAPSVPPEPPAPPLSPWAMHAPSEGCSININSIPASEIMLDGHALGSTPKIGVSVPCGLHTVDFIHPEKGKKSVTLNATPDKAATAATKFD